MSEQGQTGERRKMDIGPPLPMPKLPERKENDDICCLEKCPTEGCQSMCCRPPGHKLPHWCQKCNKSWPMPADQGVA
jgi:hypothetical protein